MAIKAGRVGVAPNQVDEFGNISSAATSGYTKQEADAKFETQSHAASTYETKSDATALQPKTLEVPIELLSGSALTVESALQGIQNEVVDLDTVSTSAATNIIEGASVSENRNYLLKNGKVVQALIQVQGVTATAYTDTIFEIPEGYRPKIDSRFDNFLDTNQRILVNASGTVKIGTNVTGSSVLLSCTWITE